MTLLNKNMTCCFF